MGQATKRVSARTSTVDEARALCHAYLYPVQLDPVVASSRLPSTFDALVAGPVTVAVGQYGAAVRVRQGNLESAYHVNVPLSGSLQSVHRGVAVLADQRRASIYGPYGLTVLDHVRAGCRVLCVKVDRAALHAELEALLGHPVRAPLELAPDLDVATGPGLSWRRLLYLLSADMHNEDGLLSHPGIVDRLGHEVLHGLLHAAGHKYRPELTAAGPTARPGSVRRAIDAMQGDPAHPFTVTELAAVAGVSVRALQEGFRRHVGETPLAVLRGIRLAHARRDLLAADPDRVAVSEVAYRWGLAHLGRFAAAYRTRFGEPPSATLHRR